jgi:UDP-GlcNAc:undecaprenyl-phosphate/decaprenyl-phosphate GlcNAc-1-phosphate transferase
MDAFMTALAAAAIAAAVARILLRLRLAAPPVALMRINVSGQRVPAVLGSPLVFGAICGMFFVVAMGSTGWQAGRLGSMGLAVGLLIVTLYIAGSIDDRRGDEPARGFGGHLAEARRGRLTGGLVKMAVGGLAGLGAGVLIADGRVALETGLMVALTANLLNLLDRAPGRAGKAAIALAVVPVLLAPADWVVASAGLLGALLAVMPADLGERAMLGDAGANPIGAVVGLGLATSASEPVRIGMILVLLALNLASEKWSFSQVIERTPALAAVDRWGRKRPQD